MDWVFVAKVAVFSLIGLWAVYVATTEQDSASLDITWRPWVLKLQKWWRG